MPSLRFRRQFRALGLVAVLIPAALSANPPDGLLPLPPKPPAKPDILPDLPTPPPPVVGALVPTPLELPSLPRLNVLPTAVPPPRPESPMPPVAVPPAVRYVNKPDVEFDFEVTKKGRAGVKSAVLWMRTAATDGERTDDWKVTTTQPVATDGEQKIGAKLPADGRYEFRLQLVGENGRQSAEVKPDSKAEMAVVLDTKPPVIKDVRIDLPLAEKKEALIRWTATDANLGNGCLKLEYEQKPGGPWVLIGEKGLNTGSYSWPLDDKLPVSTRVRVTVTDLAGNTASAISEKPTNLDPVVPEGKLTGVRAVDPPKPPEPERELAPPPVGLPSLELPKAKG